MSDENPVSARLASALAGAARALAVGAAAGGKDLVAARWEKSVASALGALLGPLASRDDAGERTALRLLALAGLRPAPSVSPEPSQQPDPAAEKLPKLSPNLAKLLGAFFNEKIASEKESADALGGLMKELSQELSGVFSFTAATFPSGPGGPLRKIPPALLRKLEQEFIRRLAKIANIVERIGALIGSLPAPRLKFALFLLNEEIRSGALWARVFVGAGLSAGGMVADAVQSVFGKSVDETPSSREIGNQAHNRLQAEYRAGENRSPSASSLLGGSPNIVQDNMVYWPPSGEGELSTVAWLRNDGSLLALLFARFDQEIFHKFIGRGSVSRWLWSQYREDTLDLHRSILYEIKPVRSAGFGVVQEFHYRHSYNIANGALQDLKDLVGVGGALTGMAASTRGFLNGIKLFSAPLFVYAGPGINWVPYLRTFQAEDRVVFPFTVTNLPGLVLYLALKSPSLQTLLAISPALAAKLRDELEKLARRAAWALEAAFYALVAAIAVVVFGILIAALAEFLLAAAAGEGLLIGGLEALRRLIALVPATALVQLGFMPAGIRVADTSDEGAADAIIKGLRDVAQKLELAPEFSPQIVGDRLFLRFKVSPEKEKAPVESSRLDIDFSCVSISGLPIAAFPLLKYLHELSVLVASHTILRHADPEQPAEPAPPPSV